MRLDAWLKQQHSPAERLRLVERLAQALNAVHDRGESLASIAPERVEVGSDLKCDLGPSVRGRPEPGYAAPERLEGGPASTAADIYALGALCWEVLVGRACGEAPKPLLEVVPDLPSELANSVMGCLERSPEWRPKDLTYLAQLAAAQQKAAKGPEPPPERASPPPRPSAPQRATTTPQRPAPRRASRSHLPLYLAAALLVAAAASSYLWLRRESGPAATARARPLPTPVAAPTSDPAALGAPAPTAPTTAPSQPPVSAVKPTPPPLPATPVATAEPEPTPTPIPTPTPVPVLAPPTQATEPLAPIEPASLTALSPPSVRRPGKVLLDIRGAGLRADQRVRILPLKEAPQGITVVRQKWASTSLVTVLLELDASVTPAAYAVALESASGERTNPLPLTVTK